MYPKQVKTRTIHGVWKSTTSISLFIPSVFGNGSVVTSVSFTDYVNPQFIILHVNFKFVFLGSILKTISEDLLQCTPHLTWIGPNGIVNGRFVRVKTLTITFVRIWSYIPMDSKLVRYPLPRIPSFLTYFSSG